MSTSAKQRARQETSSARRWCVYILRCADGTLYTGSTNHLERRLRLHAHGRGAKYLRGRLPAILVYRRACRSLRTARHAEGRIKRLTRAQKRELIARPASRARTPPEGQAG